MRLRFTQAARKHRVGTARIRAVVANPVATFLIPPPGDGQDERTLHLGEDDTGRALEVMTVPLEGGDLLVIHAMDLRPKYRRIYELAKEDRA